MSKGKKLLILALIFTVIGIFLGINKVNLENRLPDEYYKYCSKDIEEAGNFKTQWISTQPVISKISYKCFDYVELVSIVVAIMSMVSLLKNKEKGTKIAIIFIIIVCGTYVYSMFGVDDMSKMDFTVMYEESEY